MANSSDTLRPLGVRHDGGADDALSETRYLAAKPGGILNAPASTHMPFWSINPYVGCEFGCAYCYARETHKWTIDRARRRGDPVAVEIAGLPPDLAFERRIVVKEGAAKVLAELLPRARVVGTRILIGSATDPYQPAERRFALTRSILEVFLPHTGLRIGLITKSALVMRDAELMGALVKRHDVTVSISLAAIDPRLLRRIEARTPVPRARLRALSALAKQGVRVGILVAPILPGINDGEPGLRALLTAAKDAGAVWARYGALRMGPATRSTLFPWLERHRPDLAAKYRRHYGSGWDVSEEYANALRERFHRLRDDAGFPRESYPTGVGEQVEMWPQPSGWD